MSIIFLDVDGVFNPNRPSEGSFTILAKPNGVQYKLILNKRQSAMVLKLAADTNSQLVWATTWEDHANEWVGPALGFPELPVVKFKPRRFSETLGSIKARGVTEYAAGAKFVYFDDEYDIGQCLSNCEGIHIYVNPKYGLGLKHIVEAEAFLTS
jgi:hypothetical protein